MSQIRPVALSHHVFQVEKCITESKVLSSWVILARPPVGQWNTVSFGDMVIWVDAKTLEKPLLRENECRFGILEKNPQAFLAFS